MDAKGLMIGNYLKNGGVVVKIDARSIFDMFNDNPKYQPIELDFIWLDKFGFKITDAGIQTDIHKWVSDGGGFWMWHDTTGFNCYSQIANFSTVIKYVHQLQNLWFTIVGSDLELVQPQH